MHWKATLALFIVTRAGVAQGGPEDLLFEPLGDLPGGQFSSTATDISPDGSVVVGWSLSDEPYGFVAEAFRWENGEMTGLGGPISRAEGVSSGGEIVVGTFFPDPGDLVHAFHWSAETGLMDLGIREAQFLDVSSDGSVIVGERFIPFIPFAAFRWEDGVIEDLAPGTAVTARAISDDGSVIVGNGDFGNGIEAFRWTEAGGVDALGDLPGGSFQSIAFATSEDGSVIVGMGNGESDFFHAFKWDSTNGMVDLETLPGGTFSAAAGVSGDGSVIVGSSDFDRLGSRVRLRPFIWDAKSGMRDLQRMLETAFRFDLTGWELMEAAAVSSDGRSIVGNGVNPNGDFEAWIARVPEIPADMRVDIKPRNSRNPVNPKSKGQIRVAVLGTADLDVLNVDVATLEFGRGAARPRFHGHGRFDDANRDGRPDLIVTFRMKDTGISIEDTEACLTGRTFDEELLWGCDAIRTTN